MSLNFGQTLVFFCSKNVWSVPCLVGCHCGTFNLRMVLFEFEHGSM